MKPELRFALVMAGAIVCLGIVPLLEKMAVRSGVDSLSLAVCINTVTVLVLLIPAWPKRPSRLGREWGNLLVIGFLASGLVVLLNIEALQTTSATHRSVFQAMYPASTALFALVLLRERLPLRSYGVIAMMCLGVVVLSSRGLRWDFAVGDLLLLATLPLIGFSDAWTKRSMADLSPQWLALGRFFFGTVLLLTFLLGRQWQLPTGGMTWGWILLSGLGVGLGILLLYQGMALKGAALAAAMLSLTPVLTMLLEAVLLGERFNAWEVFGMMVVMGGGFLLTRQRFQHRTEPLVREQRPPR